MSGPHEVLVVADGAEIRADIERLLCAGPDDRFAVVPIETAAKGIARARDASASRQDHCMVLDFSLPDMEADAVLTALARPDGSLVCPVIVLIDEAERGRARALIRAGAQDYLDKNSMTADSLTRALDNAIERWEMGSELRLSEERLARAQRAARIGTWDWDVVRNEASWTEEAWRLFGPLPFSQPVTFELWLQCVHPDDRERAAEVNRLSLGTGRYFDEFRVRHPDGTELWLESRGEALYDGEGRSVRMLGTVQDITSRKRTEQAARQAEEARRIRERELQSLADNVPAVVARFDRQLRHVFINAGVEQATGLSREAFLGKTNRELGMPAALCDEWEAATRRVLATGQATSLEFQFDGPAGRRCFASRLAPEFDSSAVVQRVLAVSHDITERKVAEDVLREEDRRKNVFLATLAHELRSPLAPLGNGLQLLKLKREPEAVSRTVAMMERQLAQLIRLIDDLMDIPRITSGKVALRLANVRLQEIVGAAVESVQPAIDRARQHLSLTQADHPLCVVGDAARLTQIVGNLLTNASKYTPDGGRIEVCLRQEAAQAVIAVSDDGMGVPPEQLTQVFEMFTQVNRTLDRAQGGLGIGLALVKQLVELHRGSIAAVSAGPGRGSTFTVRFALATGIEP